MVFFVFIYSFFSIYKKGVARMFNITPVHPETVSIDGFKATENPNVFIRPGATLILSPSGDDALLVEMSEKN